MPLCSVCWRWETLVAGDTICHSCMQLQDEERCIQCDGARSSWRWCEERGLCFHCRGHSLWPRSLEEDALDEDAGVVLAGDEPEPEPEPTAKPKIKEEL